MGLKKIVPIIFFSVVFGVWFFSLLELLIPITGVGTPTFPITIDVNMKTMFLTSTILLAATSFMMSLERLGTLSHVVSKLHRRHKNQSIKPV